MPGVAAVVPVRAASEAGTVNESPEAMTAQAVAVLRQAGARFAYLHGSRVTGRYRPESDIDIAAYFGGQPPRSFDVLLPHGVDLLILDDAPLELDRVLRLLRSITDDVSVPEHESGADESRREDPYVAQRRQVHVRHGNRGMRRCSPAHLRDRRVGTGSRPVPEGSP